MRQQTIRIGLLFIVLLSAGCANISIQSIRDPDFNAGFNNIYVLINHAQLPSSYSRMLIRSIGDELTSANVSYSISLVNPLQLDDNIYDQHIDAYKPEGILVLIANGGVSDGLGGFPKIIYDVSVYDFLTKKRVWRGNIDNAGGTAVVGIRMEKMSKDLVTRLLNEGILRSEPTEIKKPSV